MEPNTGDYMANGRFSRGAEVIADASMAFVGNIDHSIDQLVRSSDYDLFLPLPKEFDLAVMDRFACYLPGWEIPKNTTAYLTNNYGFITDYLAEAFHYQLKHVNKYEEVSSRIKLGKSIEGRDEIGIKKTVCAFLKVFHPIDKPSDEEFDEYVSYAVEARRRVKEQMNKRKPDDVFANIDLSFINAKGKEIIIHCPESIETDPIQEPIEKKSEADLEIEISSEGQATQGEAKITDKDDGLNDEQLKSEVTEDSSKLLDQPRENILLFFMVILDTVMKPL